MCCGYYEKIKAGKMDLNVFYGKRYGKIFPFFALLVLIDLAVSLVLNGGITTESLYEAFSDLTLMYGFFATFNMSVIGVGWTLGVIFGFYILFPFFVFLIWTKRRAWLSMAVSLGIYYVSNVYFRSAGSLCIQWMCYFLAGGLLYLYRENIENWMKTAKLGVLTSVVGFAIVFLVSIPSESSTVNIFIMLKNLIGFSIMIVGTMCPDTRIWSNAVSRFVSSVSLEIYLSHMLVFRVIEKVGLTRIAGESVLSYVIVCILTTVGVMVFATAYQWCEKKIRQKIKVA